MVTPSVPGVVGVVVLVVEGGVVVGGNLKHP